MNSNPSTSPEITLIKLKSVLEREGLRSPTILETLIANQKNLKVDEIEEMNRNKQRIKQILLGLEKQKGSDDLPGHVKMYIAKHLEADTVIQNISNCIQKLLAD